MSRTSFCSGRRSITGNGVSGSNSVELAPSMSATWRAGDAPPTCTPQEKPRKRTPPPRHRHAQADAQEGHPLLARVAGGADLPLDPPDPEAAGDQDAVAGGELLL